MDQAGITDDQSKWKLLKYDMRKFKRTQSQNLEDSYKHLEFIKTLAIIRSFPNVKMIQKRV